MFLELDIISLCESHREEVDILEMHVSRKVGDMDHWITGSAGDEVVGEDERGWANLLQITPNM